MYLWVHVIGDTIVAGGGLSKVALTARPTRDPWRQIAAPHALVRGRVAGGPSPSLLNHQFCQRERTWWGHDDRLLCFVLWCGAVSLRV